MLSPVGPTDPTSKTARAQASNGRAHARAPGPLAGAKWGWATRSIVGAEKLSCATPSSPPRAGDVVLVRVESSGNHSGVVTPGGSRSRIYPGDRIVGVIGTRYATDAFEGEIAGWDELHMLTNGGMIGTVRSRHASIKAPTPVALVGRLASDGRPLNLKDELFRPGDREGLPTNVLLVVGAGMNSGKTTTAARLTRELTERGVRTATVKITGSVSSRDLGEYQAAGAVYASDFSDHGFPSTYLCSDDELIGLYARMIGDAGAHEPRVIIAEIADGVLQQETQTLLRHPVVRASSRGILLAAPCALSALGLVDEARRQGHDPIAVTGIITNAPLFRREFSARSDLPVVSSVGAELSDLGDLVLGVMKN